MHQFSAVEVTEGTPYDDEPDQTVAPGWYVRGDGHYPEDGPEVLISIEHATDPDGNDIAEQIAKEVSENLNGGTDLAAKARDISRKLTAAGFDPATSAQRQVMCLAEEVGEFVGAYRRWAGMARRTGTAEDVRAELADVVIAAYVAAVELGFDLDEAIASKLGVVYNRGWRESA